MNYDYILLRYGEIALKGRNRYRFEDRLIQNLRNVLKDLSKVKITKTYGRLYIKLNGESYEVIAERLKKVFGIVSFSPVIKTEIDMETIKEKALYMMKELTPQPKTFKVETKRAYKEFPLKSLEVSYEVGSHILKNTEDITVDVHQPDITLHVEIRQEGVFIFSYSEPAIGGMPFGTGGRGFSLLSGGIDSPVATWFAMKRGLTVEGIHFHTFPITTVESVQKVIDLAKVIAEYSGFFKLHLVPFLEIQNEIRNYAPESHNITMMRRMFLRIAQRFAIKNGGLALVTGESIGQVASQTLESMFVINQVTNIPIIRPLITMDKLEIMNKAEDIGTYEASIRPHEDCCTVFVPKSPATKPSIEICEKAESLMDVDDLIDETIDRIKTIKVTPHSEIKAEDFLFTDIVNLHNN